MLAITRLSSILFSTPPPGYNYVDVAPYALFKFHMTENPSILNMHRCFFAALLCLLGLGLGGCASMDNKQLARSGMQLPIKIMVVQAPVNIEHDRLKSVFYPDSKAELSVPEETISTGLKHAQEYASAAMESALSKQPKLLIVTAPPEENKFLDKIKNDDYESTITQEEADLLQKNTGAHALLKYRITDYGLTPKSWRNGYITFEVTTTPALAAVIAYTESTVAKAAAAAYLVQESIEETASAYAGFWALDVTCRPVRIEAKLIRLNPLTTLWQSHDTGLSDVRLSRLTRKIAPDERDKQLDQATGYAVKDVVAIFADALDNIKPEQNQPATQ